MNFGISYEIWAVIAIILKIFSYAPYLIAVIRRKVFPHSISWFIWFLNIFLVFLVQIYEGAGAGAFPTLLSSLICLAVAVCAFFYGDREMDRKDYIALAVAIYALIFWLLLRASLIALTIVIFVDIVGYIPTWRKIIRKPMEESSYMFIMAGLAGLFSMIAIENLVIETLIQPIYGSSVSIATGLYILWRRRKAIMANLAA